MKLSAISLFALASTVVADGASILAALADIKNSTIALNKTIASFPEGPLGIIAITPLLISSTTLLIDLNQAVDVAKESANLTVAEAVGIAQATISLGTAVNSTLTNVINSKAKFDKLLIVSPVILLNLKLEKDATDRFGAAVVEKVPAALKPLAGNLLKPIDASFDKAIEAYDLF